MAPQRLVLASASSRRSEILSRLDLNFEIQPADIDESTQTGESALDYVSRVAAEKAMTSHRPDTVTIAADTAVILDGEILGKPSDSGHIAQMLMALSGRNHKVITGVVVVATDADGAARVASGTETTLVGFAEISAARIRWYCSLAEPLDKAGSYALQGAGSLFADRVEGSVTNVIGLPIQLVDRLFSELDLNLLAFRSGGVSGRAS